MIRLLPFILIPLLVIGGLGFWRYSQSRQDEVSPQADQEEVFEPIEVPKTLPNASLEDRVKALEGLVEKLVTQVNSLKSQTSQTPQTGGSNSDSRLSSLESASTELKSRVSALEKVSPAPAAAASGSKSTIYIPLGSGGSVASVDWTPLNSFQISLDPAQYPGYSSMQLEVNMRLNQPGGTLYARLYNSTSGSAISSEVTTTSTNSSVVTSSTFTLPSGSKTYLLQAKISDGTQAFLDTARIKVNF